MSSHESDSDAPADISFSTGKKNALNELKVTKNERKRQDNSKEWSRRRNALYKEQKDKKLLSADVLAEACNTLDSKKSSASRYDNDHDGDNEDSDAGFSDVESSDEEKEDESEDVAPPEKCRRLDDDSDEDTSRIDIKVLKKTDQQKSMLQDALDFKSQALHRKGVHRVNMAVYRKQQKKMKTF